MGQILHYDPAQVFPGPDRTLTTHGQRIEVQSWLDLCQYYGEFGKNLRLPFCSVV